MQTRKPFFITAALLAVLLALAFATVVVLESRWFSNAMSDRLSEGLGQQVEWEGPLHIDWSLRPSVRVEHLRISNPDWAPHDTFAEAKAIEARIHLSQLIRGLIAIERLELEQPRVRLMRNEDGGSNWAFLRSEEKTGESTFGLRLEQLLVANGRITYREPTRNTDIALTFHSSDGNQLRVAGDGDLQGSPVALQLGGAPLPRAADHLIAEEETAAAYALTGHFRWRDHSVQLTGTTDSLIGLGDLQFTVHAQGPDLYQLIPLVDQPEPAPAPYYVQARVQHQQQLWSAHQLTGHVGASAFQGRLAYQTTPPRPKVFADITLSSLHLEGIFDLDMEVASPSPDQPLAAALDDMVAPLRRFDAEVLLQIGHLQKQRLAVQDVYINAELNHGQLSINPLNFEAGGGEVRFTGALNAMPELPQGEASVSLQNVDIGQFLKELGYPHLGVVEGELVAQLDQQTLRFVDSRLRYWDEQAETDIHVKVSNHPIENSPNGFKIAVAGELNGTALKIDAAGGPLVDIAAPDTAYPLDVALSFADTAFTAKGTVVELLRFKDADLKLHASGPGSAELSQLSGLELPQFPAYRIDVQVLSKGAAWYLRDIRSEVGDSDLSGNLRWATNDKQRKMLWGDLHSHNINLDTLITASDGSATEEAKADSDNGQILPDGELPYQQLQEFDALIKYNADSIIASAIPLKNVLLELRLNEGVMEFTPLSLGVGQGAINIELWADMTGLPAGGHASIELSRININDLLEPFDTLGDSYGRLGGQGDFNFSGASLAQALANLQGEMQFVMTGGQLDATLEAAAALDGGELFLQFFGDNPDPVEIHCAYLQLNATSGIVDIESLTVATERNHFRGGGKINLEDETFEVVIEAEPTDFSVLRVNAPLRFHGSLKEPRIDALSDELMGRGALAAIGAAVFPPAALLPLVEPGEEEGESGCEETVAAAEPIATE